MKNVVFDFGQVLVRFEPSYMVGRYVSDPEDAMLLSEVVFDRLYWDPLDAGTISDSEVIEAIKKRLPERLWDSAGEIYYNWIYNIPEIEGMRELIIHVKDDLGASVFLLSNISVYFADHSREIPILKLVDKCIFSSVCGKVKPNLDIYEYLCSECNIDPSETVFVDDRKQNVEAAEKLGITGYVFDGNAAKLRAYLDGIFNRDIYIP
jgi:putative hydrolase of the HAD superfamily